MNEGEARLPLACLIAEERKDPGLGGSLGRIHFHLLIHCAKTFDAVHLEEVWRKLVVGEDRAGDLAKVFPHREDMSPAYYVMKDLSDPSFQWRPWRLHGASKRRPASFPTSARTRRLWRRQNERLQQFAV